MTAHSDMREIIDCHWHPAPDAATWTNWFLPYRDMREQIAELQRAGISRACGSPIRRIDGASFSDIRRLNDQALALRDRFPDFYVPGIQVHPHFPDESCAEVDRCAAAGVRWVGELVGYMMGFAEEFDTAGAFQVFAVVAKRGMAVNIHCSALGAVERLCRTLPGLKVVLAHPHGDRKSFNERIALVAALPNLHLDISGTGIDRFGILRHAIDTAGPAKVLFGTDCPINNPAVYVSGAAFEPLSEAERDALLSGNFRRLCGIEHR